MLADLTLGERPQGRTSLTARWIVGHQDGSHRLLENGELVFENDRILYVGPRFDGEVARRIDLGNVLISPGLIDLDALSDLDTTTLGVDCGPAWAKGRVWPQSYVDRGPYEMYSQEELAFQKRFSFAQLLCNGITSALPIASLFYREWGETVAEFDAAAQAAGDLGLRVWLGPAYRSGGMVCTAPGVLEPQFDEPRGLAGLDDAIAFVKAQAGRFGGLVQGMLAPDRVETCTKALLTRTMAAANDLDTPVRLHMAQGQMERDTVQSLHGTTSPQWLASFNALNNRLIAPHATFATEEDLHLYAEHGVTVAHCPLVFARSGAMLRSFGKLREMGINIGMGTDTAPPDMVLNMAVGVMMARMAGDSQTDTAPEHLFNAATLGGAAALGRPDLGRLQTDAKADIAIFDMSDALMAPQVDPIRTLILGATGRVTKAVFVDGRLSMRDGQVPTMDMPKDRVRVQAQFDELQKKYPERTWGQPPLNEMFPPSYPLFR
ncbi:N-ethylammeline chlorohydrolase [Pseudorhodobacter turbinis]|uniref:N-ethylammeline chlorohydrolase n=1 Tax=Pseudorhodobacter turbinis TaxID=2500533 RepID=A0A4P8ECW7_9RHOB|nr:amidohydrolase family protein [Pseudorhodobacter turbinis]QCO54567.1 N-ethylammeline chlorohydrolase [Pseudorhodobacter turbinis]